jgi:hypothetical protein
VHEATRDLYHVEVRRLFVDVGVISQANSVRAVAPGKSDWRLGGRLTNGSQLLQHLFIGGGVDWNTTREGTAATCKLCHANAGSHQTLAAALSLPQKDWS